MTEVKTMKFYTVSLKGKDSRLIAVVATDSTKDAKEIASEFLKVDEKSIQIGWLVFPRKDHMNLPEITRRGVVEFRKCLSCDVRRADIKCGVCGRETKPKMMSQEKVEHLRLRLLSRR